MPETVCVVGLGFGDEGKGTVVDFVTRNRQHDGSEVTVVRFNGGPQAAHRVVASKGHDHIFSQFGSGTFAGARTFLSRFMLVDPIRLASESDHLCSQGVKDPLDLLTIDREALLVTPFHREMNRAREVSRGEACHGSCGVGVGETMAYSLAYPMEAPRVGDCLDPALLRRKLVFLRDWLHTEIAAMSCRGILIFETIESIMEVYQAFAKRVMIVDRAHLATIRRQSDLIFEGAQGVLLDEWYGFHPHTTWSTTTFENAETLLAEIGATATRLGVVRSYMTRHGPGPFVSEDPNLTLMKPDAFNKTGKWQREFRVGHFDAVAHRYAVEVCGGVDGIVVTHLDRAADVRIADSYDIFDRIPVKTDRKDLDVQQDLSDRLFLAKPVLRPMRHPVVEEIEAALGAPVVLTSSGPTSNDKKIRCGHKIPMQVGTLG